MSDSKGSAVNNKTPPFASDFPGLVGKHGHNWDGQFAALGKPEILAGQAAALPASRLHEHIEETKTVTTFERSPVSKEYRPKQEESTRKSTKTSQFYSSVTELPTKAAPAPAPAHVAPTYGGFGPGQTVASGAPLPVSSPPTLQQIILYQDPTLAYLVPSFGQHLLQPQVFAAPTTAIGAGAVGTPLKGGAGFVKAVVPLERTLFDAGYSPSSPSGSASGVKRE
eukprot:tig00000025_g7963.t1